MTPANITDLIERLKTAQAALPDPRDARSENDRTAWLNIRRDHAGAISSLQNLPSDLARVDAQLAAAEATRQETASKQSEIEAEIAAFTDWQLQSDARLRDQEFDRQHELRQQLELLHENRLLKSPDIVFTCIDDLDHRISELTERRDRVQAALAEHLRTAEQLLGATVTK